MNTKKITFDLDSVIFDIKPLYKTAFRRAGVPYQKPTSWNLNEAYNNEMVINNLLELFGDDMLYQMPLLDKNIPYILNNLMKNPEYDILFVTERMHKQPAKTFDQLRGAGINCSYNQVVDQVGLKSDILKDLKTTMHFDDGPLVVAGCLDKGVPVTMISNNDTLYNHYLRDRVQYYNCLRTALIATGIYKPQHIR
jgi:hypothetical protein